MIDFIDLAQQCAPTVAHETMAAVVSVESSYNPYAIGVVGGRLVRQPKTLDEAVATAQSLEQAGYNFSLGIAQVNRHNLPKFDITYKDAFEPCKNLYVGSKILEDCYVRAKARFPAQPDALNAAFSCYYSGNFSRGFRPDRKGEPSYVQKVLAAAGNPAQAIPVVPSVRGGGSSARVRAPAKATPPKIEDFDAPVLLEASAPADGPVFAQEPTPDDVVTPTVREPVNGVPRERDDDSNSVVF